MSRRCVSTGSSTWQPGERDALLRFRADLVHDLELIDEMVAHEEFIGRPPLLGEDGLPPA